MLSPIASSSAGKPNAPSIWSFDSGYGTQEENARNGVFYLQPSTSTNSLQGRLEDNVGLELGGFSDFHIGDQALPKIEELSVNTSSSKGYVFNTSTISNDHLYLPEIEPTSQGCFTCDLYTVTNPGENIQCENCRLPETIEPSLLSFDASSKGKESIKKKEERTQARAAKPQHPQMALQTRCSACELSSVIDPSGPSNCASCISKQYERLSSMSPSSPDSKVRRSRAGRTSKLPLSALTTLQAWLDAHADNPYPSAEVKRQLASDCGITEKQVTTWFTNARARQLSPLDTWLNGENGDEGAAPEDIERASTELDRVGGFTYLSDTRNQSHMRAGSISGSSAFSNGQSRPQQSRRGKKKKYRLTRQASPHNELISPISNTPIMDNNATGEQEKWECTFCRQRVAPKSWRRHEETQHHTRAQWTCMLYGPRLTQTTRSSNTGQPETSTSFCAFCMLENPSEDHFLSHHRISECAKRPTSDRTFYRPDHLRQHVKNFHGAKLFDLAQTRWKSDGERGKCSESWTCGFCGEHLETWGKRETHIANHFKDGLTMESWTDYTQPNDKESKKQKKKEEKEANKEKEKEAHGLARLSRSFARRSTRSSQKTVTQPTTTTFANTFQPLPISNDAMTMGFSYSQLSHAPVLPDINTDPLMAVNYTAGYDDWSHMNQMQMPPQQQTHFTTGFTYDPMAVTVDANFNLNAMDFSNPMFFPPDWNPPS